jgi:hypothetical protein
MNNGVSRVLGTLKTPLFYSVSYLQIIAYLRRISTSLFLYRNLPAGFRQFRIIEKAPWNFFQDALAFYVFTF